jgi:Mn-dependent DtxR family transcriptional regulator
MQLPNDTIRNKGSGLKVTDKELTILYEIGLDLIPTATEFVEVISSKYGVSQSGVWYTIKKLKAEGLVDFAEKGEVHRPLSLTDFGTKSIRSKVVDVENRQYHYIMSNVVPAIKTRGV